MLKIRYLKMITIPLQYWSVPWIINLNINRQLIIKQRYMISCYLQNKSPQKLPKRFKIQSLSSVIALTCKQVQSFKIKYDDIVYDNKILNKFILCGIIISFKQGLSATKKPIRLVKLKDSTGICTLQLFNSSQSREWELIPDLVKMNPQPYVTVCAQAKSQGQFRFQIKLTINSLNVVTDNNQITMHSMDVIKDYLSFKS